MRATILLTVLALIGCTSGVNTNTAPPPASGSPVETTTASEGPSVSGCARAVVLVLDRSGSMSGYPMEMAKASARSVVAALEPSDCFALVTFDSAARRDIPLTHVTNRSALDGQIALVSAGGGTDIVEGLRSAHVDALAAADAKRRLVLLITDGQSSTKNLHELTNAMSKNGIALSTIGLGKGVDAPLLELLASEGGGRTYTVLDPSELPSVVAKETALGIR